MSIRKHGALRGKIRRILKALRRNKHRSAPLFDVSTPDTAGEIHAMKGWMDSLEEPRDDTSDTSKDENNNGGQARANGNGPYDSRLPRAVSVPEGWQRGKTTETKVEADYPTTTSRIVSAGNRIQKRPRADGRNSPSALPSVAARNDAIIRLLDGGRSASNAQGSLRSNNSARKVTASTLPGLPEEDAAASPDTQSVAEEAVGEDANGTVRKFTKPSTLPRRTYASVAAAAIDRAEEPRRDSASDRWISQDSPKSHDPGCCTHAVTPGLLSNDPATIDRRPSEKIAQLDGTTEAPRPLDETASSSGQSSEDDLCPRVSLATTRGSEAGSGASECGQLFAAPEQLSEEPSRALRQMSESVWEQMHTQDPDLYRSIKPSEDYDMGVLECLHGGMLAKANKAGQNGVAQRPTERPAKRPALREALGSLRRRIHETKERLLAKERHHHMPVPGAPDTSLLQELRAQAAADHHKTSQSSYQAIASIINDYAAEIPSSAAPVDNRTPLATKLSSVSLPQESLQSKDGTSWADDATAAIMRKSMDVADRKSLSVAPHEPLDVIEIPPGADVIIVGGLPAPVPNKVSLNLLNNKDLFIQKPETLNMGPDTHQQRQTLSSEYYMTQDKPFGDVSDVKALLSELQMDSVCRNASERAAHFASARSRGSSHRSTKQRLHDFVSGITARGRRLKRSPLPTSMVEADDWKDTMTPSERRCSLQGKASACVGEA